MQVHVSILHRKPRTRRERMLLRFHATREGIGRRWTRLHSRRRARNAQRQAQELFLHLSQRLHPEPVVPVRRGRLHVRHHR